MREDLYYNIVDTLRSNEFEWSGIEKIVGADLPEYLQAAGLRGDLEAQEVRQLWGSYRWYLASEGRHTPCLEHLEAAGEYGDATTADQIYLLLFGKDNK